MDYHNVTMEEVARVVESNIGLSVFKQLAANLPEIGVKYDKRLGLFELLLNMIDQEDLEKLQAGEASIKIEEIIKSLFDSTGRVIPPRGFKPEVKNENKNFHLDQLNIKIKDKDCLRRMQEYLPQYTFPSLTEFQDKCGAVKEKALKHPQIGPNAFNRCNLPLPIPHIPELSNLGNLGQILENLLEGVKRAYEDEFNNQPRKFVNYRKGTLAGVTHVIVGTRHREMLAAVAKAPQAGILLPNPLQGYSVQADRTIISLFPNFVSLIGLEYILAMIGFPDILARGRNTPRLNMSAFSWQSAYSLRFSAYDNLLDFNNTDYLAYALDYSSGGLLFLG